MKPTHPLFSHLGANYRIYTRQQLADLFSTRRHPTYINSHRAVLIRERVGFFSALFAILMPLWLVIDYVVLPVQVFAPIVAIRLASTLLFVYLAWPNKSIGSMTAARFSLTLFLSNLPLTFLTTSHYLSGASLVGEELILIKLYTLLPYMAVAGLGVFPLTVYETLSYAIPLALLAIGGWSYFEPAALLQILPSVWLLLMLMGLVLFSATIQLQYMITLVSQPTFDPMTGALSRRSGMDALVREYQMALMHNDHFAVALIDLDNVESIVAEYDYATYDHVIVETSEILREELRHNDMLVRWGEKVFLLILTNTDLNGVEITIERIRRRGIGSLPDGRPVTVSIGVAERVADRMEDWHELLDLVDHRRDRAKMNGKDRMVSQAAQCIPA
jgi:diguanylate cyclase (GGDEF)-like protein